MTALTDGQIIGINTGLVKSWREPMISPIVEHKIQGNPSRGMSSAGYDISLGKQFAYYSTDTRPLEPAHVGEIDIIRLPSESSYRLEPGAFVLAETVERFALPNDIYATVHDKSSWVRLGLSVHNTVIEPGWRGILTLELKNNNPNRAIVVSAGQGIAQVMFHRLQTVPRKAYQGQYQDQKQLTLPGVS